MTDKPVQPANNTLPDNSQWHTGVAHELSALKDRMTAFTREPDNHNLHRLRVALKRVRAAMRIMQGTGLAKGLKKDLRSLNALFRQAGKIRETHVESTRLQELGLPDLITAMKLDRKEGKEVKKLRKELERNLRMYEKHLAHIGKLNRKIPEKDILSYMEKRIPQIHRNAGRIREESEWHELRKDLKLLVYSKDWLTGGATRQSNVFPEPERVTDIEQLIGRWHDLDVLGRKIRKSRRLTKKQKRKAYQICDTQLELAANDVRRTLASLP